MGDLAALTCPNCGAALEAAGDQKEIKCGYCGTTVIVPQAASRQPVSIVIPIEPAAPIGSSSASRAIWLVPLIIVVSILGFVGFIISSVMSQVSQVTDSALKPFAEVLTSVPTIKTQLRATTAPEPTRAPRPTDRPQPTETPAPTATTVVLPTLPAYAKLVMRDDFSDPKSGWDRTTAHGNSMNYTDNGYLISIGGPGDGESAWVKDGLKDVSVEVDEETQSGAGWYGVMCRVKDGVGGYSFEIDTDGDYGIFKYVFNANGNTSKELASGNVGPGLLNNEGLNHVRGDCIGKTLTLTVNGRVIDQGTDSSFSKGGVGLIAVAFSDSANGLDSLFKDFVVRSP